MSSLQKSANRILIVRRSFVRSLVGNGANCFPPTLVPTCCSVSSATTNAANYQRLKLIRFRSLCTADNFSQTAKNIFRMKTTVLVIYCGGTIGMMKNDKGAFEPKPSAFLDKISSDPELHDKTYPIDASKRKFVLKVDGTIIHYTIKEYDPLLDSSNMGCEEWKRVALDIKENYNDYDSFIILHGTDTLAYTASALSFMLENLSKPVIITGAQISIFEKRSDAKDNFLASLLMAGLHSIPEVCVCFNNKLMRACRTTKFSSNMFDAFLSPNYHILARAAICIRLYPEYITQQKGDHADLRVFTNLNSQIAVILFHPMITAIEIAKILEGDVKGVVLLSYGIGNIASSKKDIMNEFDKATKKGIIIVNITQCLQGMVNSTYETGRALLDVGIIPGNDMTLQAAYTKLAYVLGQEISLEKKKMMMQENLRGEMTEYY